MAPDAAAFAAVRRLLPQAWQAVLRPRLQWYGCRGAFFHHDAHFGRVLFGAWCLAGPERRLLYPRLRIGLPASPGDAAIFDPFEPHGVLDPGESTWQRERYAGAEPSLFLGFELEITPALAAAFGIGELAPAAVLLSSRVAVNAETGALRPT